MKPWMEESLQIILSKTAFADRASSKIFDDNLLAFLSSLFITFKTFSHETLGKIDNSKRS